MKPGTSTDSARRFHALNAPTISLGPWTLDALHRIADARGIDRADVLDEMLHDWTPTADDAERARRRAA